MRISPRIRTIRFEQLENRQLMAADVLEVEPNDVARNATPFSLPATEEQRLLGTASKRDKDFFTWTATQSGQVHTVVSTTDGTSNLEIENRAGVTQLEIEQRNHVSQGVFDAVKGETYFVRVRGDSTAARAYSVSMKYGSPQTSGSNSHVNNDPLPSDSTVNESEPNDTKPSANQVSLPANSTLKLVGNASKQDRDFFLFNSVSSGNISIKLDSNASNVSVESRRGIKMFESETSNGMTAGNFTVEQGETYYVRVRGNTSTVSSYTVTLTHSSDPLAPTSPSSTAQAAARSARMDIDGDGFTSPLDVLTSINYINRHIAGDDNPSAHDLAVMAMDFDDDDTISPLDVLILVNQINRETGRTETHEEHGSRGEGEAPETSEFPEDSLKHRRTRR